MAILELQKNISHIIIGEIVIVYLFEIQAQIAGFYKENTTSVGRNPFYFKTLYSYVRSSFQDAEVEKSFHHSIAMQTIF